MSHFHSLVQSRFLNSLYPQNGARCALLDPGKSWTKLCSSALTNTTSQIWDGMEKHTNVAFSPFQSSIKVMINILSSRQDPLAPWNLYLLLLDKPEIQTVPSGEENSISHWKSNPRCSPRAVLCLFERKLLAVSRKWKPGTETNPFSEQWRGSCCSY